MAEVERLGVAPPDPETPVGRFRVLYGDATWEPLDPPEEGWGQYEELSDDEIKVFIQAGGDSVLRGIGIYVQSLATHAASQSRIIKDHDLQVSTLQKSSDYRRAADQWFRMAEQEEEQAGAFDIFDVHSTSVKGDFLPEGGYPIYGRRYDLDRWL